MSKGEELAMTDAQVVTKTEMNSDSTTEKQHYAHSKDNLSCSTNAHNNCKSCSAMWLDTSEFRNLDNNQSVENSYYVKSGRLKESRATRNPMRVYEKNSTNVKRMRKTSKSKAETQTTSAATKLSKNVHWKDSAQNWKPEKTETKSYNNADVLQEDVLPTNNDANNLEFNFKDLKEGGSMQQVQEMLRKRVPLGKAVDSIKKYFEEILSSNFAPNESYYGVDKEGNIWNCSIIQGPGTKDSSLSKTVYSKDIRVSKSGEAILAPKKIA